MVNVSDVVVLANSVGTPNAFENVGAGARNRNVPARNWKVTVVVGKVSVVSPLGSYLPVELNVINPPPLFWVGATYPAIVELPSRSDVNPTATME
jgi:hypothetical protein